MKCCGPVPRLLAGALAVVLSMVTAAAAQNPRAPRPAPRWADGTVNLGAPPGGKGTWEGEEPLITDPDNYENRLGRRRRGLVDIANVPMQPWARALLKLRNDRFLTDEPYTRCKPSPAARSVGAAYGIELLNLPGSPAGHEQVDRGAHTYRVIHIDGRSHPPSVAPSDLGDSIGWWDGDTLVVDTVGFNESAWMERWGVPHTSQLHTLERFTRVDFDTLKYEITIDDPGAYTAPWTSGYTKHWQAGDELFEYVCQANNYGLELMVGVEGGDVRHSTIAP